jgi:hypothetical protein
MNTGFEQAQELGTMWLQFLSRLAMSGAAFDPQVAPSQASRQVRDTALSALSEQVDRYMRSPQFIEGVKQSLSASIAFQKQLNDFLTKSHHAAQGVARQDVDALLQSVRHMETRVLDRTEEVLQKLDELKGRVDALESASRSHESLVGTT